MVSLAVWAPRAGAVEVEFGDGERRSLRAQPNGWHRLDAERDRAFDYGFRLDGADPLPDPRSRWQPHGVHGLSRWFDPDDFEWGDAGFTALPFEAAVVYEIHVGTFTPEGTFRGVEARLDHLVALGVTHVELMPVAAFAGRHGWGYDGVDLYAPHPAYGSPTDLQHLAGVSGLSEAGSFGGPKRFL